MTAPIYRPKKIDCIDEFLIPGIHDKIVRYLNEGFSCHHIAVLITFPTVRYTQRGVLEYCKRKGLIQPLDTRQSIKWRTKTGRRK